MNNMKVQCKKCATTEAGTPPELVERGWGQIGIFDNGFLPWWDDGMMETLAIFVLCPRCYKEARPMFTAMGE